MTAGNYETTAADYRDALGPPPSALRLLGGVGLSVIRSTVAPAVLACADGLLRLAGTNEVCPCRGNHDASLKDLLHTAWWQGYYAREKEVAEDRL